jgi:uncharacterized protein YdhG (YjbR/CyaY superfamily)
MSTKPTNVDEYLATAPDGARNILIELHLTITSIAPDAVEVFGYGMPGFKYLGKPLVYFGVWKNHCALYGLPAEMHQAELAGFDMFKGTIRFQPDKPLPASLLKALLIERIAAIDEAAAERKRNRSTVRTPA